MSRHSTWRFVIFISFVTLITLNYQACTFGGPERSGVGRTGADGRRINSLELGGNGNGYDGKVYVSRGQCGADYFAPKSVVQFSPDGKTATQVIENCAPIPPKNLKTAELVLPPENRNVISVKGQIYAHESGQSPELAGKIFSVRGASAAGKDRLLLAGNGRLQWLAIKDGFLVPDQVITDNSSGQPFPYDGGSLKLVAAGVFGGSDAPQLIFQKGDSLFRRELRDDKLAEASRLSRRSGGHFRLGSQDKILGAADILGGGSDQILVQRGDNLKAIVIDKGFVTDTDNVDLIFNNGYDGAVVQQSSRGGLRFVGLVKLQNGSPAQPFRELDDVLEVAAGDPRVSSVSGGTHVEVTGKSLLSLNKNQTIVAIGDLEGDERSEILFEENGSIQLLRHAGEQMDVLTIGNLAGGGR
ncbi:MAG: hypothetical protein HC902_09430 [Calothrix sp. SM1_5_4]|nr:hypothetical protein [Calothrix sp. SM1_5_4]